MTRLAPATALLFGLLLPALAAAQEVTGNFEVEGRATPGNHKTRATLAVRTSGSGGYRIERTGRFTTGPRKTEGAFTWRSSAARRVSDQVLRATYRLEPASGYEAGLVALGATASDADLAGALGARNVLEAVYIFSPDGKSVREVIVNTTRVGAERWRQIAARGQRVEAGPAGPLPPAELQARVDRKLREWYAAHIEETYAELLADATGDERTKLLADREADRDFGNTDVSEGDEYFEDELHEAYANDDPYLRADGSKILESDIKVFVLSMFPEYAGIGLSKSFAFDARTGELIAESDIQD